MVRSCNEIRSEAAEIGENATTGQASDNACIQVLAALVEELAENVETVERELKALKKASR